MPKLAATPQVGNKIKKLKVLFVSAEVAPFSSVGGLSQVMYFLSRALIKLGHDVRIFTPKFGLIDEKKYPTRLETQYLKIPTGHTDDNYPSELICNVKEWIGGKRKDPIVYFLENMEYFEKRANVYAYEDDHVRFGLLSRGAIEWLKKSSWVPDVINANDWHTGYLADYMRNDYQKVDKLKKVGLVFSIHNLPFQGMVDFKYVTEMDVDDGRSQLSPFFLRRFKYQNSVKRGIIYSDVVNTVSEQYAKEIITERYGEGLHQLLKEVRTKVFGILNGLDYTEFDPRKDKIIYRNYSVANLELRTENKLDLQGEFGLPERPSVPLLAIVGRLTGQKGIELIKEILPHMLSEFDIQFIALGPPDPDARHFFTEMEKQFPKKVGTHLMSNFTLPRKIFAGSDIFLVPSAYEPGGITAIEAMRYGAVPLVRATGGLADTVQDYDPNTKTGTGFSFVNYDTWSFFAALIRALETYKNAKTWQGLIRRAMLEDFSWVHSARGYTDLYLRAIKFRREQLEANPHPAYVQKLYQD
jgi:starch synthase